MNMRKIYDHKQSGSVASALRSKRLDLFKSLLSTLNGPVKILDVGGRAAFWESTGLLQTDEFEVDITLLNTSEQELGDVHPRLKYFVGDAREMSQFKTKEFDIVFSNSVIEHVGTYVDQRRMAQEVERVGKRFFIQTPNFYFPIEPHFVFPAFHWLPIKVRVWLVTHFALGWYKKFSCSKSAQAEVESVRLLKENEFTRLYPNSKLFKEKFMGLTKSFIVYSEWDGLD
jgi:hypothetical protein